MFSIIWKARNDFLFNKKSWPVMQVYFATKSLLPVASKVSSEDIPNHVLVISLFLFMSDHERF